MVVGWKEGVGHWPPSHFLTQIPIHKRRDTGKSFIKHTTVYSGVKKKKFPSVSRV